jgi:hypothetical protein
MVALADTSAFVDGVQLTSTGTVNIAQISIPTGPSNVFFSGTTTSSTTLAWSDNSGNESGWHVYRSTDGIQFTQVASLPSNQTSFTDSNLSAGTAYIYRVAAWNSAGESALTSGNITTVALAPVITLPAAPSNLGATNVTTSGLTLAWSDVATNESGYRVYRSTDGSNYTRIADLPSNSSTYSDTGLSSGTTYYYKIAALNSAGESLSQPLTASTQAVVAPPPPSAPLQQTSAAAATVSTRQMTSFTELVITGTSGNDSIYVSQSGNSFTIVSNGNTQTINGTFGDLVVHAGNGGATITVDSSVTINTLVYGGAGNDTLVNKASAGYTAIVSIGGGNDVVTGNGSSTSYWADTTDGVNSSAAESTGGYVHKISQFYQPWTTNSSSADYVSTQLGGQNLRDPGDIGSPIHYSSNSLFGTGATAADVNQWQISDCYLLADLAGVANGTPAKLYRTVIDLGDGTYGVQFTRNGVSSVVRVDGDFGAMQAHVGNSGNLWSLVVEKAYAYYRFGSNTYSSLNYGSTVAVDQDLGISVGVSFTSRGAARLYSDVTGILAGGGMATVETASILAGAPLIGNHAYSIAGAYQQNGVYYFVLRNPWGFDGTGSDSNPGDGLVTLTFDQIQANFSAVYLGTIKT